MLALEIVEFIGMAGGVLILAAWASETLHTLRKHKVLIHLEFSVVSLAATLLLWYYSVARDLAIFVWINGIISLMIVFEMLYSLHLKSARKKRL